MAQQEIDLTKLPEQNVAGGEIDLSSLPDTAQSGGIDLSGLPDISNDGKPAPFVQNLHNVPIGATPQDLPWYEDFGNAVAKGFVNYGASYNALVGNEEEAKRIREQSEKDYPTTGGVASFMGDVVTGIAPTIAAIIPGPQQPIVAAGVLAHYGMTAAGDGLMTAWDYEDETGNELSDLEKGAIAVGFGATVYVAERLGLKSLEKSLNRLAPTALKKLGKAFRSGDIKTAGKELFKAWAKTGTIEGLEEGTEQILTNGIQALYDERRSFKDLVEGVPQSIGAGAIGGALVGSVGLATGGTRKSDLSIYDDTTPEGKLRKQLIEASPDKDVEKIDFFMLEMQARAERNGMTLSQMIEKNPLEFQAGTEEDLKNFERVQNALFQVSNKQIPEYSKESKTQDAIALGLAIENNMDMLPDLTARYEQASRDAEAAKQEYRNSTELDPMLEDRLVTAIHLKQLYGEAIEVATGTGSSESMRRMAERDGITALFQVEQKALSAYFGSKAVNLLVPKLQLGNMRYNEMIKMLENNGVSKNEIFWTFGDNDFKPDDIVTMQDLMNFAQNNLINSNAVIKVKTGEDTQYGSYVGGRKRGYEESYILINSPFALEQRRMRLGKEGALLMSSGGHFDTNAFLHLLAVNNEGDKTFKILELQSDQEGFVKAPYGLAEISPASEKSRQVTKDNLQKIIDILNTGFIGKESVVATTLDAQRKDFIASVEKLRDSIDGYYKDAQDEYNRAKNFESFKPTYGDVVRNIIRMVRPQISKIYDELKGFSGSRENYDKMSLLLNRTLASIYSGYTPANILGDPNYIKTGFRLALRRAIENGADKITWDTGETIAKRYGQPVDLYAKIYDNKMVKEAEKFAKEFGGEVILDGAEGKISYAIDYDTAQRIKAEVFVETTQSLSDLVNDFSLEISMGDARIQEDAILFLGMEVKDLITNVLGSMLVSRAEGDFTSLQDISNFYTKEDLSYHLREFDINSGGLTRQEFIDRLDEDIFATLNTHPSMQNIYNSSFYKKQFTGTQVHSMTITPELADFINSSENTLYQKNKDGEKVRGAFLKTDEKSIIKLFNGSDLDTIIHEMGHYFRSTLSPEEQRIADEIYGIKDGEWSRKDEEQFAEDWTKWHQDGLIKNKRLRNIFLKMARWLKSIYAKLSKKVELTDDKREFFESLLDNRKVGVGARVIALLGTEARFVDAPDDSIDIGQLQGNVKAIDENGNVTLEVLISDDESETVDVIVPKERLVRHDFGNHNQEFILDEAKADRENAGLFGTTGKDVWRFNTYLFSPEQLLRNHPLAASISSKIINAHLKFTADKRDFHNKIETLFADLKKQDVKIDEEAQIYLTTQIQNMFHARKLGNNKQLNVVAKKIYDEFVKLNKELRYAQEEEFFNSVPEDIKTPLFEALANQTAIRGNEENRQAELNRLRNKYELDKNQWKRLLNRIARYYEIKRDTNKSIFPVVPINRYKIVDIDQNIYQMFRSRKEAEEVLRDLESNIYSIEKTKQSEKNEFNEENAAELIDDQANIFEEKFFGDLIHTAMRVKTLNPALREARRLMKDGNIPTNMRKILVDQIRYANGVYGAGDAILDDLVQRYKGIGIVKKLFGDDPRAMTRAIGRVRSLVAKLKLGYRPVAAFVNAISGFGHTWVKVGNAYMQKATDFLATEEGKRFLEQEKAYTGIDFSITDAGEIKNRIPLWKPLGLFQAAEPKIREHSLAANYLYAREMIHDASGQLMNDAQSREFARRALRFQNFTYNAPALPMFLRNNAGKIVGQFKSYLIKEMEFIAGLKGSEIARYIGLQTAIAGPRGMLYTLKTLPILGAMGLLDALEEWLIKDDSGLSRGIGGLAGVDITAPATFQLPNDELRDWAGPLLSDMVELFKQVILPAVHGEGFILPSRGDIDQALSGTLKTPAGPVVIDPKQFDPILNLRTVDWVKGLSPISYYWSDLIDSWISNDGYIYDAQGRKQYPVNGWYDQVKLALGASPLQKAKISQLQRLQFEQDARKEEYRKFGSNKLVRSFNRTGKIDTDLLERLIIDYNMTPRGIVDKITSSKLTPQFRNALQRSVRERPAVLQRFSQ